MSRETTMKDLSTKDYARLAELETTINKHIGGVLAAGQALAEIRESKLYRQTHGTFEEYCQEKWGFVARRARQLISAAEVAETVTKSGTTGSHSQPILTPTNERQARELSAVPAEKRGEVWAAAVEDGNGKAPTAATVKAAAKRIVEPDAIPIAEAMKPAVPWAEFDAEMDEAVEALERAFRLVHKAMKMEGKVVGCKWAKYITPAGALQPIRSAIVYIRMNRPAGVISQSPGYETAQSKKISDAVKGRK